MARLAVAANAATAANAPARYPQIDLDAAARKADLILLSTEPFMFRAEHVAELQRWLPAKRVALIDGEMTSWYGSRAIVGLDYLRRFRTEAAAAPVTNPQPK